MIQDRNELHTRIKDLRIKKGYTQQQIADLLQVDKSAYAHYEAGRRTPNAEKLKVLAEFYGLYDELLGASLPVITSVAYPEGMLESFEKTLKEAESFRGKSTMELIALYRHLDKEFQLVLQARMQAFDFPELSRDFYEEHTGQTIQVVKLVMKGEQLIEKYFKLQEKIFEAIQSG